jgi:acetyl esterase/lipase
MRLILALLLMLAATPAFAQTELAPRIEHIRSDDGALIDAHIFAPPEPRTAHAPVMLLFHGGGWSDGDATWTYARAQHYAAQGMVTIGIDYRLSGRNGVTPLQAMQDARASVRWVRAHARDLGIDRRRVVALGWSAGGQLAVLAALSRNRNERPNALVLISPALDLAQDDYFIRLMGDADAAARASPLTALRRGMPPTVILQGETDRLTPARDAQSFCARIVANHDRCEIQIYPGFGHLFTPAGGDDENPQPDPETSRAARDRSDVFLRSIGYLDVAR